MFSQHCCVNAAHIPAAGAEHERGSDCSTTACWASIVCRSDFSTARYQQVRYPAASPCPGPGWILPVVKHGGVNRHVEHTWIRGCSTQHSKGEDSAPARQDKQPQELLGFLRLQGVQHWLRLRKKLQLTDVASAELGVDLNVKNKRYMPHMALSYDVRP